MANELAKCLTELEDLHDEIRARGVATLAQLDDPVGFLLLDRLAAGDSSIQLRFAAKKVLHQLKESLLKRPPEVDALPDPVRLKWWLDSSEPAVRKKCLDLCLAVRQLAVMPLVPPLLEREQDPTVKRSALLVAALAGRHAVRVLAPFLTDSEPSVREAAIIGLGVIDDVDIFPHAVQAFVDPAPDVQRHALRICSRLGKANFNRLLERMAASSSAWKRLASVKACARIRQAHLRPLVERLWEDADPEVRQAAQAALSVLGEAPASRDDGASREAGGASGASAAPAPAAASSPAHAAVPAESRRAPPKLGTSAIPKPPVAAPAPTAAAAPAPMTQPPLPPRRAPSSAAASSSENSLVALSGPESPSSVVTPILGGADPARSSELAAWVAQSDTARVPEIQQWFDRETEPRMRASLVTAAGKLGGRLAVDMLKKCLSDPDGRIRANAVEALMGKVRPESLVGLLHDSDNRCRANAIVALKDHKRVDVLKHLKTMASGDASSRKSAIYAIVEVGTPEAAELLKLLDEDLDADVKEKARQAREILTARMAEAAQAAEAEGEAAAAGGARADAGAGKFDQLKSRIAEAFGAFRKKLGQ